MNAERPECCCHGSAGSSIIDRAGRLVVRQLRANIVAAFADFPGFIIITAIERQSAVAHFAGHDHGVLLLLKILCVCVHPRWKNAAGHCRAHGSSDPRQSFAAANVVEMRSGSFWLGAFSGAVMFSRWSSWQFFADDTTYICINDSMNAPQRVELFGGMRTVSCQQYAQR